MRGHYTVVVVGGGDECGGILGSGLQVVNRRISFQVLEHFLAVLACPVIACPVPADGELVVAEHIHYPHLRNRHTEEVGALRHAGSYQQSAVRTAYNGYSLFVRIFIVDQVFGGGDEVVEYILLLHLRAGDVPFFAILASAAQVYLYIDAAVLEEWDARGGEIRVEADAESAVSVQEYGVLSVLLQVFLVGKEHRYLRSVFAGEEDLLGDEIVGVELYFGSPVKFVAVSVHIIFIRSSGDGKRGESEEALFVVFIAAEAYRTERRQLDFVYHLSVETVYVSMVRSVFVVSEEELSADDIGSRQYGVRFRHEFFPVLQLRLLEVGHHDSVFRRAVIGKDIDLVADYFDRAVLVVEVGCQLHERRSRFRQVAYREVVSSACARFEEEENALVFAGSGAVETFRVSRIPVNELVARLRFTYLVIIYFMVFVHVGKLLALHRSVIGAVVEAVFFPACTGELRPLNMVVEQFARFGVHHEYFRPVGAAA